MTTQKDWRLRNVIRSVTYISGDSSFPWYIEASPHCNNLRRKVNKEGSTKPQTSVREINSNSRTSKFFQLDGLLLFCIIMGLRSASSAVILFSCLMYLHLLEIAIYLWLGSIGDTTEFQMPFIVKLREIIYFRQLIVDENFLFSVCKRNSSKRSLFRNRYSVLPRNELSLQRGIDGVVWRDQTTAARGDNRKSGTDVFYFCWEEFRQ